jgi:hypothetical protein
MHGGERQAGLPLAIGPLRGPTAVAQALSNHTRAAGTLVGPRAACVGGTLDPLC